MDTPPRPPSPTPWNLGDRRVPPWFLRAVMWTLVAIAGFMIARAVYERLSNLLVLLLVSLFVSFAVEPMVDWLADRGFRRGPATALVFVLVFVFGGVLVFLIGDLVVRQLTSLVDESPTMIRDATAWVNQRFGTRITTVSINEQLRLYQGELANTASDVGGRVVSVTGSVLTVVFNGLTVALFSFYLVADGPRLRRNVCSVFPPDRQRMILGLWELAIRKTGGYLYSRVVLAIITAVCGWVAFAIIGLPSPIALAVWAGVVAQFVPVLGTYIGGALPLLITLVDDPPKALWVLAYLVVYQQIENYWMAPRIAARTMQIHPAVAFASAIAGAELLGPVGAFLALPAAAIVQAFVSSFLHRYEPVGPEEGALPTGRTVTPAAGDLSSDDAQST